MSVACHQAVGVFWLGEGSATLVVCVYVCVFSVEEGRCFFLASRSAVAIVSHEGDDAGRGSR